MDDIVSYVIGKKKGGTTPTGEIDITQNGITNVSGYATANVQVPEKQLEEKSVTISTNTTTLIEPSTGKDGMSSVSVITNIPGPSGKITITQNGTDIDVSSYASADVNVGSSTPTTFEGWTQKVNGLVDEFANYIKTGLSNSRTAFTNSAVTLYTPDTNCKSYFICQKEFIEGLKYQIYWYSSNNYFYGFSSYQKNQMFHWDWAEPYTKFVIYGTGSVGQYPQQYLYSRSYNMPKYYYSGAYDTMEELVNAVKNDEVTYTAKTNIGMQGIPNVLYSNACMITEDTKATGFPFDFLAIDGIISHNETIEVTQQGA